MLINCGCLWRCKNEESESGGEDARPFGADGVNFVDENDGGRILVGDTEQLPDELRPVAQISISSSSLSLSLSLSLLHCRDWRYVLLPASAPGVWPLLLRLAQGRQRCGLRQHTAAAADDATGRRALAVPGGESQNGFLLPQSTLLSVSILLDVPSLSWQIIAVSKRFEW